MNRGLAIVVALVVIGGSAFLLRNAADRQDAGMAPEDGAGAAQGAALAEVRVPDSLGPTALIGKRVFEAKCASCHGRNAAGQSGIAPPLVHQIYRPAHHADAAFLLAARSGVRAHHWNFGDMPPVEGLTDADVKAVAAYVRELQRANGIN